MMERLLSAVLELLLPLRSIDSPERVRTLLRNLGYALPDSVALPQSPIDFRAAMSESIALSMRLQTARTLEEKLVAIAEAQGLVHTLWAGASSLHGTLVSAVQ